MCLGALGSQTGGSITRPAAFCGVAGLKPTHGRLPVSGILPLAPSLDHPGPIARIAADLALLWEALAGPASGAPTRPPRLGRLRGLFDDRAEPAMRAAFDRTLAALAGHGAVISEPVLPDSFPDVLGRHRLVMAAEAAAVHEARLADEPDDYPPRIRALIEEGLATRACDYVRAREHQALSRREILSLFDGLDALITPAALGPAPGPETTGDPAFNSPWSYTGLPTVSIPVALAPDGLPLAIQLVGPPGGEGPLLGIAAWCEQESRQETGDRGQ
jgi:aspartyl-tRNA(Asn)/glutamyl-tRNA(Gln) amidotransferase subunit A